MTTYGEWGGRYVPETLIPALDELTDAWNAAKNDPSFVAEVEALGRDYTGRPSPLTLRLRRRKTTLARSTAELEIIAPLLNCFGRLS